jgi:hypothetical protein
MRRSNIKRLESVARGLRIQLERLEKVVEVDWDVMQAKDKYYLTDAYLDILYMAKAMERIKAAREQTPENGI